MSIPPEVAAMLSIWREMDGQRFSIYLFTFPWFGSEMKEAGYLSNQPDAPAIHAIEQRAHAEWTRLTGLRPLCNEEAWRLAAAAAAPTSAWADLTCRELGEAIRAWAGAKAANGEHTKEPPADDSGKWSAPDTPQRWAVKFNVSVTTFKRHCKAGKIRHVPLTDRSYRVHVDDIPPEQKPARKPTP